MWIARGVMFFNGHVNHMFDYNKSQLLSHKIIKQGRSSVF